MANVFDYLAWRGDIPFSRDTFNTVDSLIFSCLSYLRFAGRPTEEPYMPILLSEAAEEFFQLPDAWERGRHHNDVKLLKEAAKTVRFGQSKLVRYRSQFVPEDDTQFAAETFLLDDDSAVIAFRGTDNSLVGWKEDFNMSYQQTVPSQLLAVEYLREVFAEYTMPLRLCGHSKGGNLAVFAASRCSPMVRNSIVEVYNNDGPGFTDYLIGDPGYLAMVSRIHTHVPQSSVIGMLMEHEEPVQVIQSSQIGLAQHDVFSWEVMGKALIPVSELTPESRFLNTTINNWLKEMDLEQRNKMVEALFALLSSGNVEKTVEILQPKNLKNYLKVLGSDEGIRKVLTGEFENLVNAAVRTKLSAQDALEAPKDT